MPAAEIERLKQELAKAESESEDARRRALKALAKANSAKEDVESLESGPG